MNILILARGYPDFKYPMNGIFEYDQAKALAAIGHSVTYFAIDLRSLRRRRKFGIVREHRDGIEIYCANIPVGAVPMQWLVRIGALALKGLYDKVYASGKAPDIIHAHFYSFGYLGATLKKRTHIPLVITEHASEMNRLKISSDLLHIATTAYSQADCVIAVSSSLAKNIYKNTNIKCKVIPNIVSTAEFKPVNNSQQTPFSVISTGNLVENKRMHNLIDAFYLFHHQHRNSRLGIVGDGPARKTLEDQVKQLGLNNHITFYGLCNRRDFALEYHKYRCFALASASETFGVAFIEAMASGLPVIATRCGGPEDFVTEENGILVEVDDVQGLADAMETMYQNIEQFNRRKISDYAVSSFSPERVAKLLTECYRSLLDEAHL